MDAQAIQAKLDALNNPKKGGAKNDRKKFKWVPKVDNKYEVRIIPLQENPDNPFQEVFFHYGYGKRTIYSPLNYGEKDPIVEFSKNLRKSKDPEDWKLAKKLEPKMRIFALVIVRGEEDQGVRLWEFGKGVYKDLLTYGADEDIGDYTDVMEGRDIKVTCTQGAQYKETSIMPSMKQSPLSKDADLVKKYLEEQPKVEDMYKKYTFDEIKGFLQQWLNPEEETSQEESEEQSIVDGPSTDFEPTSKKEAITDNEFEELFENEN